MVKILQVILTTIILSFYFFPIAFRGMSINTKTTMAAVGLVLLGVSLAKKRKSVFNKELFILSIYAMLVSVICFFSVTYNGTNDFTYSTYFISMWVWLSAAYVVVSLMKKVHGYISVLLLCNYLIALCAIQCILALAMNFYAPLQNFVLSSIDEENARFIAQQSSRLFGIGAGLDVAGSRFSCVLVMIALLCTSNSLNKKISVYYPLYILAFLIIAIIGNMIARTTTMGLLLGIFCFIIRGRIFNVNFRKLYSSMLGMSILVIVIATYAYFAIPEMNHLIRYGFEGFFSLVEKGKWEVHSNELLHNMYVFPDNLKTWLIGDGYFANPYVEDPYYVGKRWIGFYMDTDVGYLRFIYYFGIVGLIVFSAYMIKVAKTCMSQLSNYRILFVFLLLINFILWLKVSTDIFLVFALFLCMTKEDEDEAERLELSNLGSESDVVM